MRTIVDEQGINTVQGPNGFEVRLGNLVVHGVDIHHALTDMKNTIDSLRSTANETLKLREEMQRLQATVQDQGRMILELIEANKKKKKNDIQETEGKTS